MHHFLILAIIMMILFAAAVAFFAFVAMFLVFACAIGLPIYLLVRGVRPRMQHFDSFHSSVTENSQAALDRLKTLYIEGKIDLFEFERRAAHLISIE